MERYSREVKYILEIASIIPLFNHKFAKIDLNESGFVLSARVMSYFVVDYMGMRK